MSEFDKIFHAYSDLNVNLYVVIELYYA